MTLKLLLDRTIATLVFLAGAPVLFLLALVIQLRIGRPILYRQLRTGYCGNPFLLYKFRTMRDERDEQGEPLPDEMRMTPIGSLLRRTSLDELPQLINVLRGELSLVGPRPLLHKYWKHYTPEQARRFEVKPGITGWAQINGRNDLSWEEKFTLDVWYVDNRSLWLDVKILVLTLWQVLLGRGISQAGHATTPEFEGSPLRGPKEMPVSDA